MGVAIELNGVVGVLAEEGPRRHPSMGLWHIWGFHREPPAARQGGHGMQAGTGHTHKKAGLACLIG